MMQAFVNPTLERRSAHLACNIFNEKFTDGTVMLIELISQWFKILNMKNKNIFLQLIENLLLPSIVNYESFTKLKILEVFKSCKWGRGGADKVYSNLLYYFDKEERCQEVKTIHEVLWWQFLHHHRCDCCRKSSTP